MKLPAFEYLLTLQSTILIFVRELTEDTAEAKYRMKFLSPKAAIIALFMLLCCAGVGGAQNLSVSGGLGAGSFGLAYGVNASYSENAIVWSIRFLRQEETRILSGTSPSESVTDLAILVGTKRKIGRWISVSFEIGGGPVWLVRRGAFLSHDGFFQNSYEKLTPSQAGLAAQSQLYFGHVGLHLFANYNARESFGGALLSVRFGK